MNHLWVKRYVWFGAKPSQAKPNQASARRISNFITLDVCFVGKCVIWCPLKCRVAERRAKAAHRMRSNGTMRTIHFILLELVKYATHPYSRNRVIIASTKSHQRLKWKRNSNTIAHSNESRAEKSLFASKSVLVWFFFSFSFSYTLNRSISCALSLSHSSPFSLLPARPPWNFEYGISLNH